MLVILVAALVLFGPRKLPELSRSLGKSLAEFKRASEEFKNTWEQEANIEQAKQQAQVEKAMLPPEDNSIMRTSEDRAAAVLAASEPREQTFARNTVTPFAPAITETNNSTASETSDISGASGTTLNIPPALSTNIGFDSLPGDDAATIASDAGASSTDVASRKRDWL